MKRLTKREQALIEGELYDAIRAFHDCDDKEKRNEYVKGYTLEFCEKYNIDPLLAVNKLNALFKDRRKRNPMFPYEHYKGNALKKIIIEDEEEQK